MLLGVSYYVLQGLGYLLDAETECPIISPSAEVVGQVALNVVPCDENGDSDLDEDMAPDDPQELIEQPLHFKVKISHAANLPEDFCRNIYCEYKFYIDDTVYRTDVVEGRTQNPNFNYERKHEYSCVTQKLLDYLADDKLQIKIYGFKDLKKRGDGNSSVASRGVNDTLGSSFDQSRSVNSSVNTSALGSTKSTAGGNRSLNKSGYNPLA